MPIRPVARGQFPRAVDRVTTTAALNSAEQRERVCAPSGKRTSTGALWGPLSGKGTGGRPGPGARGRPRPDQRGRFVLPANALKLEYRVPTRSTPR